MLLECVVMSEFPLASVRIASSAAQALAIALEFIPQIVISDGQLADGIDGVDAVRSIREALPPLKAVLVTGDDIVTMKSTECGRVFDAHLLKPLQIERLVDMLRGWI